MSIQKNHLIPKSSFQSLFFLLLFSAPAFCIDLVPPVVSISNHDTVSKNDTIVMSASAYDPDGGSITTFSWHCGSGGAETGSATHSCVASGGASDHVQFITVSVTDDDGQSSSATSTVFVKADPPTVTLSSQDTVSVNDTIRLTASAHDVFGKIMTYTWNCGSGGVETGSAAHSCVASGGASDHVQFITVSVTDDDGQSSSATSTVFVKADPPTVTLSSQDTVSVNDTIRLTASAHDGMGRIVSYSWHCGSGGAETGSAAHSCVASGGASDHVQFITVSVTDDDGQSSSATSTVFVKADPPTVTLTSHDTVSVNDAIRLTASAHDVFGKIMTYTWNCGSGGAETGSATHSCVASGGASDHVQFITVSVTDDDGQSSSATSTVFVKADPPTVTLSSQDTVSVNDTIRLTASAHDVFGKIMTYTWNCGDGSGQVIGDSMYFCIAKQLHANQMITVMVIDDDGQSATVNVTVYVSEKPVASVDSHLATEKYYYTSVAAIDGRRIWSGFSRYGKIPDQIPSGTYFIYQNGKMLRATKAK
ncbi:MAG: hypothetical protein IPO40_18755 [Fibrobacteres bacterium]|nr:hypothetical protein [Fibrobacterota bacterium]